MIVSDRLGSLRLLKIDRPEKRNALTPGLIQALRDGIRAAAADPEVSGVVIAGEGPAFCSGVDLGEFATGDRRSVRALIELLAELCGAARRSPKPVAAAVQGACIGGAFELALACDFRVASPDARFGLPEVLIGIPSVIDAALLERYVGLGRAREMILTGRLIDAGQAHEWGIVNRLAEPDALVAAAGELIALVNRATPEAIRVQKALFEEWLNLPFQRAVESSKEALAETFEGGEPQRIARERLGGKQ